MNDADLALALETKLRELNDLLQKAHAQNMHVEVSIDSFRWFGKAEPFSKVNVKLYRILMDAQHA